MKSHKEGSFSSERNIALGEGDGGRQLEVAV